MKRILLIKSDGTSTSYHPTALMFAKVSLNTIKIRDPKAYIVEVIYDDYGKEVSRKIL